jgi:hypothetical protein
VVVYLKSKDVGEAAPLWLVPKRRVNKHKNARLQLGRAELELFPRANHIEEVVLLKKDTSV